MHDPSDYITHSSIKGLQDIFLATTSGETFRRNVHSYLTKAQPSWSLYNESSSCVRWTRRSSLRCKTEHLPIRKKTRHPLWCNQYTAIYSKAISLRFKNPVWNISWKTTLAYLLSISPLPFQCFLYYSSHHLSLRMLFLPLCILSGNPNPLMPWCIAIELRANSFKKPMTYGWKSHIHM